MQFTHSRTARAFQQQVDQPHASASRPSWDLSEHDPEAEDVGELRALLAQQHLRGGPARWMCLDLGRTSTFQPSPRRFTITTTSLPTTVRHTSPAKFKPDLLLHHGKPRVISPTCGALTRPVCPPRPSHIDQPAAAPCQGRPAWRCRLCGVIGAAGHETTCLEKSEDRGLERCQAGPARGHQLSSARQTHRPTHPCLLALQPH